MRRCAAIGAAGLALALAGCGGGGEPPAPAAPSAAPGGAPAAPSERRVRFRGPDGKDLAGLYRPAGDAAPAVVLVNGLVGGPGQWDAFAPHLHAAGFATLAYQGRAGVDEAASVEEVAAAVAFLRGRRDVDARRLAVVGSSVGATAAVLAMTGPVGRRVRAAVALSPLGRPVFARLRAQHRYHPRALLFLSDQRERESAAALARGAAGSRTLVSEAVGHGVALLEAEANRRAVLDWLARRLG